MIKDSTKRAEVIMFGGLITLFAFVATMINSLRRLEEIRLSLHTFSEIVCVKASYIGIPERS